MHYDKRFRKETVVRHGTTVTNQPVTDQYTFADKINIMAKLKTFHIYFLVKAESKLGFVYNSNFTV